MLFLKLLKTFLIKAEKTSEELILVFFFCFYTLHIKKVALQREMQEIDDVQLECGI
jgi:hypothetical protein